MSLRGGRPTRKVHVMVQQMSTTRQPAAAARPPSSFTPLALLPSCSAMPPASFKWARAAAEASAHDPSGPRPGHGRSKLQPTSPLLLSRPPTSPLADDPKSASPYRSNTASTAVLLPMAPSLLPPYSLPASLLSSLCLSLSLSACRRSLFSTYTLGISTHSSTRLDLQVAPRHRPLIAPMSHGQGHVSTAACCPPLVR